MQSTAPPRHSKGRRHVVVTTAKPSATAATPASFQSAPVAVARISHASHASGGSRAAPGRRGDLVELPATDMDDAGEDEVAAPGHGDLHGAPARIHVHRDHRAVLGPAMKMIEGAKHRKLVGLDAHQVEAASLHEFDVPHHVLASDREGHAVVLAPGDGERAGDHGLRKALHPRRDLGPDHGVDVAGESGIDAGLLDDEMRTGRGTDDATALEAASAESGGEFLGEERESSVGVAAGLVGDLDRLRRHDRRGLATGDLQKLHAGRTEIGHDGRGGLGEHPAKAHACLRAKDQRVVPHDRIDRTGGSVETDRSRTGESSVMG